MRAVCETRPPSAHAIAPSAELATFSTTHGFPVRRWYKYGRSDASTAAAPAPTVTAIPLARKKSAPPPKVGSGSSSARWTFRRPLATSAASHAGVDLPGPIVHGSSVTYAVAPSIAARLTPRAFASARAAASACGPPLRWWYPSARTVAPSAATMTQPTHGLGAVLSRPRSASSSAYSIQRSCASVEDH